uniref:Uncharacterized protein isoform X2 n=1 Tax=Pogona vitticeps TaxID=103695 RepID=A0ABM5GIN4_9SAUR
MPPKKGGGNKKGKAPAKRRPAPQVSPPRSSSDEESWAAIRDLQAKVAILEAKKREKQAPGGGEVTPRRSARDTKGRRRAEMRAMTQELTRRLNAVDSEQEQDGDGWNVDKGTTSGGATGGRKRKRNEAADCAGVAEGTSAGYDPYDEPSTSSQGAFEASCATGAVPDGVMLDVRRNVTIVGHSYVFWAARYAASSRWGNDLGLGALASIFWKGMRGMQWVQFGRMAVFGNTPPDILVVHLGGNDLPQLPGKALILDILRDLGRLHALYPAMRICWSSIIPRLIWRGARDMVKVHKACRRVNKEICRGVSNRGLGSVIHHHRLQISNSEYFRDDGVHLSEAGLDIFLEDLRGGLLAELGVPGGYMGHS